MEYRDKNGDLIKAGMVIKHDDGEEELIYSCGDNNEDLGVNASNEKWLEREYGDAKESFREFYPLYQFRLSEWTIVKKDDVQSEK